MATAGQVDVGALVAELARRDPSRSEADLQAGVATLLLYGGLNLEDEEVRLETPAPGQKRVDIETGLSVIECKKDLSVGHVRDEAIEQLAGYVRGRTGELGMRYAGILTDGREWRLYHLSQVDDDLREVSTYIVDPNEPDVERLLVWLESVISTAEELQPTPLEVSRRLASDSPGFDLDLAELRDVYEQLKEDPEVQQKRELWARLLAAAFGSSFENETDLFIEHTYLVLTAEVIAHAVVGFDLGVGEIEAEELVTGMRFREAEIGGVVEADFFDWPICSEQGVAFVETLTKRLSRFSWKDVEHDVLKVLYESVIDPETRHSLGEYYTPDWIAQRVVSEVVDDPLNQRVLDPACGSGTFLFWAIRRYLAAAEEEGADTRSALNGAVGQIFGIDLHPVAVTLARVTYLLAIGTERLQGHDPMSIPVYLGDSIQLNQATSVLSSAGITVSTSDGLELFARELNFPESVVSNASRFDRFVDELATKAGVRLADGKAPSINQMLKNYGVEDPHDREMLEETYKVLCHLFDHHRDHIWGYYVRNLARPLEFTRVEHRVDRLVGNPPWLRYNAMTAQTQEIFRRLTRDRNLQAAAQVVTSQDLSALFVARSIELYLRLDGRFGFVMPAAALSRLQYEGFRSADYTSGHATAYVNFDQPWELSEVAPQPFPVPASVVFGSRVDAGEIERMPASALWWKGDLPDHHRSWDEVEPYLEASEAEVVTAGVEFASPYAASVRQGSNLVPRSLLMVVDRDPGPLGPVAGRRALEGDSRGPQKAPGRDLPSLKGSVEEQFIVPVLLGDSILPFAIRGDWQAVIPWDGKQVLANQDPRIESFPGFAAWWREAEARFNRHKRETTKVDLLGQIDYQGKLRLQLPPRKHRVAYTGRGERVTAARVSDPEAIVDHALYWAAFETKDEALYVAGMINSDALNDRIQSALSKGLFGGRNIHRAPFLIPWPQFDPADDRHSEIADVARRAEEIAAGVGAETGGISTARRRVREALEVAGVRAELEEAVERLLGD
jgi:SAM-dependent methyltransferase